MKENSEHHEHEVISAVRKQKVINAGAQPALAFTVQDTSPGDGDSHPHLGSVFHLS